MHAQKTIQLIQQQPKWEK